MKKGFTIVEVLCVMGIIALLAALLFPVLRTVRESALVSASESNLHQLHIETSLYRIDWNGEGIYGDAYSMGLPPMKVRDKALPLLASLQPPRAPHPISVAVGRRYWNYYLDPQLDGLEPSWEEIVVDKRDQMVLYFDPFNNDPGLPLDRGSYISRFLIGVNLGGSIVRKRASRDWMDRDWWFK